MRKKEGGGISNGGGRNHFHWPQVQQDPNGATLPGSQSEVVQWIPISEKRLRSTTEEVST